MRDGAFLSALAKKAPGSIKGRSCISGRLEIQHHFSHVTRLQAKAIPSERPSVRGWLDERNLEEAD